MKKDEERRLLTELFKAKSPYAAGLRLVSFARVDTGGSQRDRSNDVTPLMSEKLIKILLDAGRHEASDAMTEAISRKDWEAVERIKGWQDTLDSMDQQLSESDLSRSIPALKQKRQAAKKGGRPRLDWEAICQDFDRWTAQDNRRPKVVARLANKYETRKDTINRILREKGRGR